MEYILTYRGRRLSAFSPNDLPVSTKNGFSIKNIFEFSNKNYIVFSTYQEAQDYLKYIISEIKNEDNCMRWNSVHWCADQKLNNIAYSLKVYQINKGESEYA